MVLAQLVGYWLGLALAGIFVQRTNEVKFVFSFVKYLL
jgi:hypothetical protein